MANEIKASFSVNYANPVSGSPALKDAIASETENVTQTNQEFHGTVVSVGFSAEEDLSLGDVTTNGKIYVKNLDATNFVKYGPKSGGVMVEFGRLKPGEIAWLRLAPGITWRWIADTAAVKVLVKAYGN